MQGHGVLSRLANVGKQCYQMLLTLHTGLKVMVVSFIKLVEGLARLAVCVTACTVTAVTTAADNLQDTAPHGCAVCSCGLITCVGCIPPRVCVHAIQVHETV